MRRLIIQRCLLTITLAVLLVGGILVIGCTNAQTEGEDYNANALHGSNSYVAKETPNPDLHPYIEPTGVPEPWLWSKGEVEGTQKPDMDSPDAETESPAETPLDIVSVPPARSEQPTETPIVMTQMNYVEGYVNETYVNLRSEPSTEAEIVKVCVMGTPLYVIGRSDEWFEVVIGDIDGFMARDYVKLGVFETPTPQPTPKPRPTSTPAPTPAAMYTVYEGQFSKSDIKLVAALIHCEGPGSSKVGYRAIASIVLNRVMNNSGKFPNDIQGVLFQSGQFGYSKSYLESITPNSKAFDAANYVFSSHGSTLPKRVLFYRASYLGKPWTEYTSYYATIEGNNYYYGLYYF